MNSTALRLRRACWIAMLAMLALVLAPTVSHALAAARGTAAWVEICTQQGAQRMAVDEQTRDRELSHSASAQLEHCAYCSMASHVPALPSAHAARLAPPLAGAARHVQRAQVPRPRLDWQRALPRAPPAQF